MCIRDSICHSEEIDGETSPEKMTVYYSLVPITERTLHTTLIFSNHSEVMIHLQKNQLIAHAELMEPCSPTLVQIQGSPILQVIQGLLQAQPKHKSTLPCDEFFYEEPELEVDQRDFDNLNVESTDPEIKKWVRDLCLANKNAFAKNKWHIGCTNESDIIHFSVRSSVSPHQGKGYAVSPKLIQRATLMLTALLN